MLFKNVASTAEIAAAEKADKVWKGGALHELEPFDFCRTVSFVDHWDGDRFIPQFAGQTPWGAGRTLASGKLINHPGDWTFAACHSAFISYIWSNNSARTVVLPFLYSWTDFHKDGIEVKDWLVEGCPKTSKVHKKDSPIPFKTFEAFYNWYVDPEVNPVFKNTISDIESFEVYRLNNGVPIGIKLVFKPSLQLKKMGAMLNLSRFLYDSFYEENTLNRRKNIVKWFNKEKLTMKAAVILTELSEGSFQCGHSLVNVTSDWAAFNWLSDSPQHTPSSWTSMWGRPHENLLDVSDTSKSDIHTTLKDWIKKGLIPDVYVHEDTKAPKSVRSGERGVSSSGDNVRAGRLSPADVSTWR